MIRSGRFTFVVSMIPEVFLFLESLGGGELLVILLFILIFFGSKKIPDLARGLGRAMREFRNAMSDVRSEIEQVNEPSSSGRMDSSESVWETNVASSGTASSQTAKEKEADRE
jgi:sec-independent protein translocase protein TatA